MTMNELLEGIKEGAAYAGEFAAKTAVSAGKKASEVFNTSKYNLMIFDLKNDISALLKELIPQDLLKFGLIPEFIGRLPVVSTLDKLDRDTLVTILTEPKNALVKQYKALLGFDNVELEFTNEAIEAIADKAIERNTGARGLRSIIEDAMIDVMFDTPSDDDIEKVVITEDCVKNGAEPTVYRKEKKSLTEQLAFEEPDAAKIEMTAGIDVPAKAKRTTKKKTADAAKN